LSAGGVFGGWTQRHFFTTSQYFQALPPNCIFCNLESVQISKQQKNATLSDDDLYNRACIYFGWIWQKKIQAKSRKMPPQDTSYVIIMWEMFGMNNTIGHKELVFIFTIFAKKRYKLKEGKGAKTDIKSGEPVRVHWWRLE
jgi:hypothetical protein